MDETIVVHTDPKENQCSLIIITCPATVKRLSFLVETVRATIEEGIIRDIHIICGADDQFVDYSSKYLPDREIWNSTIKSIWHHIALNIYRIKALQVPRENHCELLVSIIESDPELYFPFRELTQTEISVAARHLQALDYISNCSSCLPTIIIEDDAQLKSEHALRRIIKFIHSTMNIKDVVYFDLCDNYIPGLHASNVSKSDSIATLAGFRCLQVAITRTLMAYSLSPRAAALMADTTDSFCIPIDMHYQYILESHSIPGYTLLDSIFIHGSKYTGTGMYRPAVKQGH